MTSLYGTCSVVATQPICHRRRRVPRMLHGMLHVSGSASFPSAIIHFNIHFCFYPTVNRAPPSLDHQGPSGTHTTWPFRTWDACAHTVERALRLVLAIRTSRSCIRRDIQPAFRAAVRQRKFDPTRRNIRDLGKSSDSPENWLNGELFQCPDDGHGRSSRFQRRSAR